jgi:hypothetical protein
MSLGAKARKGEVSDRQSQFGLQPSCLASCVLISAVGHYRTLSSVSVMSALSPIADIRRCSWNVRKVPIADIRVRAHTLRILMA